MRGGSWLLSRRLGTLLFALVGFGAAGCVATAQSRDTQAESAAGPPPAPAEHATAAGLLTPQHVSKAPPAARPPRPKGRALWVAGFWHWDGVRYVWVPGHWETPDAAYAWPRR